MLLTIKNLISRPVKAVDGDAGTVRGFYFDDRTWVARFLAVRPGEDSDKKSVLLPITSVLATGLAGGVLSVNLTREQVLASPEIDYNKPIDEQMEARIAAHYQWPTYWDTATRVIGGRKEAEGAKTAVAERVMARDLINTSALFIYTLETSDGATGKITDIIVDDASWDIRDILIDIEQFAPGRQMMISPRRFKSLDWMEGKIRLDLSAAELRTNQR